MFSVEPNLNSDLLHCSKKIFFKNSNQLIDFAILSAMPEETEYLKLILSESKHNFYTINGFEITVYEYKNKRILVSHTGFGTTFAASVITLIHNHFHPNYMFFSGTAGGIKSNLKIRDVVIVEKAFEAEIQGAFHLLKGTPFESCLTHPLKKQAFSPIYSADEELLSIASSIIPANSSTYTGTVVSSNAFPAPQELFDRIKTQDPLSIDMETSAIYQVAWLLNIRVLAVRGISNILNHDGTDENVAESDVAGSSEAAAKVVLKIIDYISLKYDAEYPLENSASSV